MPGALAKSDWDVIDLSHPITPDMPVYPGTEPPQITVANTIEKDLFTEKLLRFYSHTGTHVDAPGHILLGARTLDRFPLSQFYGQGVVIDVSGANKASIDPEDLQPHQEQIAQADFILIHSGWSERWGSPDYFDNYPLLSTEAARWLVGFPIKGIGVDMISVDPIDGNGLPVHRVILGADRIIIENLTQLKKAAGAPFEFACWPLYIENADGSPVRAVAIRSRPD